MAHDPQPSLLSSLPSLEMPSNKTSRAQKRQRGGSGTSRTLDPHDLSARLSGVLAEREAADAGPQSLSTATTARSTGSDSNRNTLTESATAGRKEGRSSSRSRRTTLSRQQEEDDRRSCPLLADSLSLPSVSYGHRAPPGSTVRRASLTQASGRPSHAGAAHAAHAGSTTANPMLDESLARANSRRASSHHPELSSPHRRRRSTKTSHSSHSSWESHHEPTIFEAVATDAKPGFRHTMFERDSDKAAQDEARPRRMTADSVAKARGAGDDAEASGDAAHYEVVNDHRVDWTQADEEEKMPRSKKLLQKADSILRLRRGSSARSREGESTEGSVVDGHEGRHSVSGGSHKSPPKSPGLFSARTLWPFKKHQVAVESH